MPPHQFFNETEEQSVVKAAIVAKYFWAWAKIIMSRAGQIAYIDLFAGPGRYADGTKSTPLLILEQAIADQAMCQKLVTIFNDKEPEHARSLQTAIASLPGIDQLAFAPIISTEEVGQEIVAQLERTRLIPSLFFVDPWGYKGLSLRLINASVRNWGCDCIFFFNYNRISMGLTNPLVNEHMDALFGAQRAAQLRPRLADLSPQERELTIIEELSAALCDMDGYRYVLPFRFRDARETRTSHHLIFVSKHFRGYDLMKGIMARESSSHERGVSSFEYNAATERQPLLFKLAQPVDQLDRLEMMLLEDFAGHRLTMRQIYEAHSVGLPYIAANYKAALLSLEAKGAIEVPLIPGRRKRRAGTFGDGVEVRFFPKA
jgi:three-Cys-motif partner protein